MGRKTASERAQREPKHGPEPAASAASGAVGFCPFCAESFEDIERCPEHDLPLVDFETLDRTRRRSPGDHDELAFHDLRFGRGLLLAAGLLTLIGFFMPFVLVEHPQGPIRASGLGTATRTAMNLWIVPAVAVMLLSVALRRRTRAALRGARVAVLVMTALVVASLALTLHRVHAGVALIEEAYRRAIPVRPLAGFIASAVGAALAGASVITLGRDRNAKRRYRVD